MHFTHLNTYAYKCVCTYILMLISEIEGTRIETKIGCPLIPKIKQVTKIGQHQHRHPRRTKRSKHGSSNEAVPLQIPITTL